MKILLAEDDPSLRRVLQFKLEKYGYEVVAVEDGRRALERLNDGHWDLLLSDIKMPNVDGLELLERGVTIHPELKVVLMTAHATISQAVQAVKLGAFDYITKPFEDDDLLAVIEKASAFRELEKENRLLKRRLAQSEKTVKLIGISRPFRDMMDVVNKIAATDATILLSGPSGTGKELVARAIHARSARAGGEFIAINCGAIPAELIESELFGHTKGAFTGATRDKKGKFELADAGTIFLDEVSELATELQVKMLRVLQERVVEPVGSERIKKIDVRVLAATNADLQRRVAEGRFRADLFYRLNVIPLKIPTLEERREDIPALVKEFINRYSAPDNVSVSSKLLDRLTQHTWPGNIRELENLIERLVILRKSDVLSPKDLPQDFGDTIQIDGPGPVARVTTHQTFHQAEENIIREALVRCGWNRTKAAKDLSIARHVLLYRMKKYKIREHDAASE